MTRSKILITGASAGLGAAMARDFATKGRNLALRDELTAAHPGITVAIRALDVDDHAAVQRVFAELCDELGGLDRVIVNAGIGKGARIGTGRADANKIRDDADKLVAKVTQTQAVL